MYTKLQLLSVPSGILIMVITLICVETKRKKAPHGEILFCICGIADEVCPKELAMDMNNTG